METTGGAPLLGEPLPIELANTAYAVRGRPQEGLGTVEHLARWLREVRDRLAVPLSDADLLAVDDEDLRQARELRDAVRSLADATVRDRGWAAADVATVNRHTARASHWQELTADGQLAVRHTGAPVAAALAAIAAEAVTLFAGDARQGLHACPGPGCVLHFVRDSPRREWCSPGCGNRARAARHYAKARRAGRP